MVFMANGAGEGCEVHCEMNNALAFRFRWEIDGEVVRCVKDNEGIYRVYSGDIPAPAPPEYPGTATGPLLLRAQQYNRHFLFVLHRVEHLTQMRAAGDASLSKLHRATGSPGELLSEVTPRQATNEMTR